MSNPSAPHGTGLTRAIGIAVVVPIVLGLLVAWFAWPAKSLEPRDLPIVVAGPAPAAQALAAQLSQERPGAFAITQVADATAADAALRERSAYAALVLGADGVSLDTASGASPTVAALFGQLALQLGVKSPPVDVVPASPNDPRGAGFASGFLPLVMASLVAGILLSVLVRVRQAALAGTVVFAIVTGLVGAGVLFGLDILTGSYLASAGVIALLALAVAASVAGLSALLGPPGIVLGVLAVFLLAIPISAVAAAPELLPQPWGSIGQFLPPGAGATLLRSVAFFDGAGSAAALWTLVGWGVVGLALMAVGRAAPIGAQRPVATPDGA